jgi:hypothetical protein
LTLGSGIVIRIRDRGWKKNRDPGSRMNILDHISKSLETIFWVKILKFFIRIRIRDLLDPGSRIRDGKIVIRDQE